MALHIQLATPEKIYFDGEADDLLLNAERGELNILPQHAGLVSFIEPGTLRIRRKGKTIQSFKLLDGVLKVEDDRVKLLCPQVEEA